MIRFVTATLALMLWGVAAQAEEDMRQPVSLSPEIQGQFLAEMRTHMDTLNEIIAAIGAGDFKEAGDIAALRLDFGHKMWEKMAEDGLSPEEIEQKKAQMRAKGMGTGSGQGMGQGMGAGKGMGAHMPAEFRDMGRAFHESGAELAAVLRAMPEDPNVEQYKAVVDALAVVTSNCSSCHATFKIQ